MWIWQITFASFPIETIMTSPGNQLMLGCRSKGWNVWDYCSRLSRIILKWVIKNKIRLFFVLYWASRSFLNKIVNCRWLSLIIIIIVKQNLICPIFLLHDLVLFQMIIAISIIFLLHLTLFCINRISKWCRYFI